MKLSEVLSDNGVGALLACSLMLGAASLSAQNPIVQTHHTADPAPLVVGDRLYLFTGHDEAGADFFEMWQWRAYSTTDMANWTDHGCILRITDFAWADDRAWAAQMIERNGKFYWYVCAHHRALNCMAIGVAVGDTPLGPFHDALGKPLAAEAGNWDYIDPTVFIDNDGQAYLFWGNPRLYYARLNPDMVSIKGEIGLVPLSEASFGSPDVKERKQGDKGTGKSGGKTYKDCYTEGPWAMRRGDTYYMLYAAGGVPEHIAYSTSQQPLDGYHYRGAVMPLRETGSFTNHCGVADFQGHSYFFYHTGGLPGGGGFSRSAAVEEFNYNPDGSFPTIEPTRQGVKPIGTLNPWQRVEAETIAYSRGLVTEQNAVTGVYVSQIHQGDSLVVRNVEFGERQPKTLLLSAASALMGGRVEVHLDSPSGPLLCQPTVPYTGGWEQWQQVATTIEQDAATKARGTHDLFFLFRGFKGARLFNLDWWQFRD